MIDPDKYMDDLTYPETEPMTKEDMLEISELFSFLCEDEKKAA